MLRLFVGLELPDAVREALAGMQGGIPGARWVDPDNLHLTLRFIGEVDEDEAAEIDEALDALDAPPVEVQLAEIGTFSRGRRSPHAVWAGVTRTEALSRLHRKVESAVVRTGQDPERRKFKPHVTLARLRDAPEHKVAAFVEAHNTFALPPFVADHVTLFRSHLGHGGADYEALAHYPLARSS